jgi:ribonuclease Z
VHDLVGICITHVHGDHSYGLPGLLASASMTGRKPLLLIAPAAIKAWIDATLLHTELFLTYPLIHIDVDSAPVVYEEAGLTISRHALSHRAPSVGYRFALETSRWKLDKPALLAAGVPPGPAWEPCRRARMPIWTMARCWPPPLSARWTRSAPRW